MMPKIHACAGRIGHASSRGRRTRVAALVALVALLCGPLVPLAHAQKDVSDVFGNLGTASTVGEGEEAPPRHYEPGKGAVVGKVFDGKTGAPVRGVTVIVVWPKPADGSAAHQEVTVTGTDGAFDFPAIPAGTYDVSYVKSGYRTSAISNFQVQAGQENKADFPLPPLAAESSEQILELEPFVVEEATVAEMMTSLELRMDSDTLLNVMGSEDFSKYAATDVAEALTRVAGVNIVEGQFPIIRGLEDRYSATLFNGAPIPSPDPERQSVQLDLFPSEVVSNLLVSKTFDPTQPGNSSGGSIDIDTIGYPEEFQIKLDAAVRVSENAVDRFLALEDGNPIGKEKCCRDTVGSEFGLSIGGRPKLAEREIRFKGVFNWEVKYGSAFGFQETREPLSADPRANPPRDGGLAVGLLDRSAGRFDLTQSERDVRTTGYFGIGTDLDEKGNHKLDASVFYIKYEDDTVQMKENGYIPNLPYDVNVQRELNGEQVSRIPYLTYATNTTWLAKVRDTSQESPTAGPAWFDNYNEGKTFARERDLLIAQINGDHHFGFLEGLQATWSANFARTKQNDLSLGTHFYYEPCGYSLAPELACPAGTATPPVPTVFPVTVDALTPGLYVVSGGNIYSENDVQERQGFGRLDIEYERPLSEDFKLDLKTGAWFEHAKRDVDSSFLQTNSVGGTTQFALYGDTPLAVGRTIFGLDGLDRSADGTLQGLRNSTNQSLREVAAGYLGAKATLFDDWDLLAGLRIENVKLESLNDPFTGESIFDGSPGIYPPKYLFFDRLDNPTRGEVRTPPPAGTIFNDQILGIQVPIDYSTTVCDATRPPEVRGCVDLPDRASIEQAINGHIDDTLFLPSAGVTYRPMKGVVVRTAFSQTEARPSFRELGYYITVEPGTDDLVIGNPQLRLSKIRNLDARVEYSWDESGDLVALSGFYKTVDDPIEAFILRDPSNASDSGDAIFRTYFNNPNQAKLWGIEIEGRKNLGFLGPWIFHYLSLGGNGTYIHAEVSRTPLEVERAQEFFRQVPGGQPALFTSLASSRRLFGQPEWIANADVTFDQPEWGTKLTLVAYAISDVLDAVGSSLPGPDNRARGFTLDRYIDSYYQLDLVARQKIGWGLTFKFRVKNLTDSTRRKIYDPQQTATTIVEREWKVGRDYKFELSYEF